LARYLNKLEFSRFGIFIEMAFKAIIYFNIYFK